MHAMEGSWGLPEAETFGCIACCFGNRGEEDRENGATVGPWGVP